MRLPGLAWLEMRVEPTGPDRSEYVQRAVFLPRGLAGHAYWRTISPFHALIFGGMARNIARGAERPTADGGPAAVRSSSDPGREPGPGSAG
jgi:hypothetical protein